MELPSPGSLLFRVDRCSISFVKFYGRRKQQTFGRAKGFVK